ncbi:MAG: DUF2145 domain-containing protein [Rubrivivax sp.]
MRQRLRMALAALLTGGVFLASTADCAAAALRYCDPPSELDAAQQDRLLRFAAVIKSELNASGNSLAIVARSGVDLTRFDQRYSHAGIALQASANAPWSVRQLYYDCDQRRPRLFDQGMAGFVVGTGDPALGYVSVVLLSEVKARALEQAVRDKSTSLRLLGQRYSANAYAYGLQYQNCNQWVAEMLAVAWGGLGSAQGDLRPPAQQWLHANDYQATVFDIDNPLFMLAGLAVPWLHYDDHPPQEPGRQLLRVSMPASIEAFVRSTIPGAQRIEFCHTANAIVIRRGWQPIEGCQAQPEDTVLALD